jgi:hypothetical protein
VQRYIHHTFSIMQILIHKYFPKVTIFLALLVEALRYKPAGRGFDSRWCYWSFSLLLYFRTHYGPGVDSASNGNEYQEYFLGGKGGRCVGLTTLPPSYADCLEIWETTSWNPQGLSRPVMELLSIFRKYEVTCRKTEMFSYFSDVLHFNVGQDSSVGVQ